MGVVYTRFTARPFFLAASCLLMAGLATRSDLKATPVYSPPDIFLVPVPRDMNLTLTLKCF